jgi:predicted regulator of Ras-like GTPase activity (Roadblock/LC7/MglB family)
MPPSDDLTWLLKGLTEQIPGARSALLLSADGLVKAAHGLDTDDADHLAAVASGLHSLATGAGARFAGGDVRQVVAELDTALLFVTSAGSGAKLALLAGRETDAAVVGYQMAMLVKQVRPYLATPARAASPGRL